MKCIPKEIFEAQDYLDQLVCPLGKGIVRDPVALPCQHVFCKLCVEDFLYSNSTCPICTEPASMSQAKPQLEILELINSVPVKCPECKFEGSYVEYSRHLLKCNVQLAPCPQGCGIIMPKSYLPLHCSECRLRKTECEFCKQTILFQERGMHSAACSETEILCPRKCGKLFKRNALEGHLNTCPNPESECDLTNCGCYYSAKSDLVSKTLEEHHRSQLSKHIECLGMTIAKLKLQVDIMAMPEPTGLSPIKKVMGLHDIAWSTGLKTVSGSKASTWTFFLSNKAISKNFIAKIRILTLASDANTWKVCLGLFNSNLFQEGSWEKYKNGYGYIQGTGYAVHASSPTPYGEAYAQGDIISIEYKNGNITFYRNGKTQGTAYRSISGPFFLAVSLSDSGHAIEIMEVVEIE